LVYGSEKIANGLLIKERTEKPQDYIGRNLMLLDLTQHKRELIYVKT